MKTIALLLSGALGAFAQVAPTSSLSGSVTDPSGSLVPNAAVVLTNAGTHWTRNTATDAQGRFQFTLVPPGAYELQVTAAGFTPVRQQGINLDVDVPANLRLTLSVASSTTSIAIQADTSMVDRAHLRRRLQCLCNVCRFAEGRLHGDGCAALRGR